VQLRKASQRLNDRILDHLPRGALIQSARALGLRHSGEIVLTDMLEANVILDYALHDYRKGRAPSTIERFVSPAFDREAEDLDDLERALRRYKAATRFSLMSVAEVLPGFGVVLDEMMGAGRSVLLADIDLAGVAEPGATCACRYFEAEGFSMSTGLVIGIDRPTAVDLVQDLALRYGSALMTQEGLGRCDRSEMVRRVLRVCLQRCALSRRGAGV